MADSVLYIVCMPAIGMRHRQWLSEDFPLAFRIATGEVTGGKYQRRTAVEELHALYLAQTVAVYRRRTLATAGTYGTPSRSMGMEGDAGFITGHTVKANVPGMTFFSQL